jgi:hypothetical protein
MKILAAIKREQKKVRKQLAKLQNQLNGLVSAAEALGNSTNRQVNRELKGGKKRPSCRPPEDRTGSVNQSRKSLRLCLAGLRIR